MGTQTVTMANILANFDALTTSTRSMGVHLSERITIVDSNVVALGSRVARLEARVDVASGTSTPAMGYRLTPPKTRRTPRAVADPTGRAAVDREAHVTRVGEINRLMRDPAIDPRTRAALRRRVARDGALETLAWYRASRPAVVRDFAISDSIGGKAVRRAAAPVRTAPVELPATTARERRTARRHATCPGCCACIAAS